MPPEPSFRTISKRSVPAKETAWLTVRDCRSERRARRVALGLCANREAHLAVGRIAGVGRRVHVHRVAIALHPLRIANAMAPNVFDRGRVAAVACLGLIEAEEHVVAVLEE